MEGNDRLEGYRWVILTIVYLSILAFTFIFQSIPSVFPLITSKGQLIYFFGKSSLKQFGVRS